MEKEGCVVVSRSPTSFSTSAQLLRLRTDSFLRHQSHLCSSLSSLFRTSSYTCLLQYSAVVGFTSHSQFLPWIVFSEPDPLAQPALVSILGAECGIGESCVVMLDSLDLAEVIGDFLNSAKFTSSSSSHGVSRLGGGSQEVVADMALSSLLDDTERLAQLALSSVQSLFQSVGPVPIPPSSVGKVLSCSSSSDPVPFQRVCLLLRQHLYWVPSSQLDRLPWQQPEHNNGLIQTCTIGPQSRVKCVSLSRVPLEHLLRWYQMVTFFRQLNLQIEPTTSDIRHLVAQILTLES